MLEMEIGVGILKVKFSLYFGGFELKEEKGGS